MHDGQLQLLDEDYRLDLSQWYTRRDLARRVVEWALRGVNRPLRVLEPSAGLGALLEPIPLQHAVTAYEIDPRRASILTGIGRYDVRCQDYLQHWTGERWDLALMNPPYEDDQDSTFVRKAVLSDASRVVAILRLAALQGVNKWAEVWSAVRITRMAICVRRQVFDGPVGGTPSGGTIVVELVARAELGRRGCPDHVEVEWW